MNINNFPNRIINKLNKMKKNQENEHRKQYYNILQESTAK